ncbi:MAG: sigma-E factor negative regulatory protein [Gammaproteobacteria bacterium]
MSKDRLEHISALVDDELNQGSRFVLLALKDDQDSKGAWGRYHLIGECLRGHLPAFVDMQLAARISEALHDTKFPRSSHRSTRLLKSVAGLAIAASVAAVAILGVRQMGSDPAATGTPPVAFQQTGTESDYPTVTITAGTAQDQPARNFKAPDDAQSRLNRYLVNYNEYRANAGMQGTLPYVRIVAHEVEE